MHLVPNALEDTMESSETYDLAIVGGGPAGASAAIYTARAGLRTVVVDADRGWTRRAMLHNHLGFPDGITGPELVELGRAHAEKAGATWVRATASGLERSDGAFRLELEDGGTMTATEVLLTTGANVALAEAAGVETRPGTEPHIKAVVAVDGDGRTSVPGIWAAGTAGGVSVHTMVTSGDGTRVAINLLSARQGERYVDHDALPATTKG